MKLKFLLITITIFYGFAFLQAQKHGQYKHLENNLFSLKFCINVKDQLAFLSELANNSAKNSDDNIQVSKSYESKNKARNIFDVNVCFAKKNVIFHYHSLSPDGKKAFLQAGKSIKIFDIDSDKIISVIQLSDFLNYINSSSDASKVLTISGNNDASIWDIASGKKIVSLHGFTRLSPNFVYAGFSPNLSKVLIPLRDSTAKIWDAVSGNLLLTLKGHKGWVNSGRFSSDGKKIVTASNDGTAKFWDASSGKLIESIKSKYSDLVFDAEFSPDDTKVALSVYENYADIFDIATYKSLANMDHTGLTVFNRFSQDGTKMATSSASGNTKIWDAHSMKLLYTIFPGAWEIIFSPDGTKFLAFSPNNAPSLWDVELGNPIDWPDNDIQGVYDAKFQTDGKKITLLLQSKNSVLIQTWSFSETIGNRLQKISQKDFRDLGIDLNDLQK